MDKDQKQLFLKKNDKLINIKIKNIHMQELLFIKITKFFLENPYDEVYLREIAKKIKISPFAAKKYIDILLKENIIQEERKANLRYIKANVNNPFYKHLKIAFNINLILKSGLIEYLKESIPNITSITLYGSLAKGEDDKKSDIDLLVIGKEKHLNLEKFADKISKEITLHVFSWSEWNENAKKNKAYYLDVIAYGIPIYGELPIVRWK